jgi:hypothetical protein
MESCIKIANRIFENVAEFRYLGMTHTNQNFFMKSIKFEECLLPFSSEPFVLSSAIEKCKA